MHPRLTQCILCFPEAELRTMSKVAEKKLINEKIAKVREVVHGVSTTDIILALHSLDMNVERTIQAFCEDGASEVLDDWVRPVGSSSKNKNKKKKKQQQQQQQQQQQPQSPVEPETGAVAPSTASPTKAKEPQSQTLKPAAEPCPVPTPSAKTAPQTNGFVIQNKPLEVKQQSEKIVPVTEQIQQTFKALRAAVTDRENVLLSACGANSKFVDANLDHLLLLIEKFGSVADPSPRGVTATFTPAVVSSGVPKAVSPVQAAAIKHATSQSSISSSLGADSGVNLSPTHGEEKKTAVEHKPKPAKVACGGIQMQSDALTPEQLEALQRSLIEQLAACGIDASVLSGVTAGDMPVRRPRRMDGPRRGGAVIRSEKNTLRPQLSIL